MTKNFKIYWQHFQSKLNYFLPVSALLKLYHAFVHPQLLNRFIIWGSTYPTKIFPFVKIKLLGSSVEGFTTDHATTPFNLANQILKPPDLLKHEVAKVVFRHLLNNFPLLGLIHQKKEILFRATKTLNDSNPSTFLNTVQSDRNAAESTKQKKFGIIY